MENKKTLEMDIEQNMEKSATILETGQEEGIIEDFVAPGSLKHLLRKLTTAGVEIRGLEPVPPEARTHTKYYNIFTLFGGSFISILP